MTGAWHGLTMLPSIVRVVTGVCLTACDRHGYICATFDKVQVSTLCSFQVGSLWYSARWGSAVAE